MKAIDDVRISSYDQKNILFLKDTLLSCLPSLNDHRLGAIHGLWLHLDLIADQ